jgi:hypothetical protein
MTNHQRGRTLQQARTTMPGTQVLARAKEFFARRSGVYSAFLEKEGPTYLTLRGQGGEEIAIGVASAAGDTIVTGTSYMFDQQVARFLASLPPSRAQGNVGADGAGMGTGTPGKVS